MGPLVALAPPALMGIVAVLILQGSSSVGRGAGGFVLGVLAAPLLPALGAPIRTGSWPYLIAIGASAVLWMALGVWAAARATRSRAPQWGRFWAEYAWMALCVWAGVALGLLAAVVAYYVGDVLESFFI